LSGTFASANLYLENQASKKSRQLLLFLLSANKRKPAVAISPPQAKKFPLYKAIS
jgi:hypothetical protein